jgi:hypothetical protein
VIKGRISTARTQHAGYVKSYLKRLRLFVLMPIEDPEKRRLLGADYFLRDFSQQIPMYCLTQDLVDLGLEVEFSVSDPDRGTYCFVDPESARHR